jgi:hypothetical protein
LPSPRSETDRLPSLAKSGPANLQPKSKSKTQLVVRLPPVQKLGKSAAHAAGHILRCVQQALARSHLLRCHDAAALIALAQRCHSSRRAVADRRAATVIAAAGSRLCALLRLAAAHAAALRLQTALRGRRARRWVRGGFTPRGQAAALRLQRAGRGRLARRTARRLAALRRAPAAIALAGLALLADGLPFLLPRPRFFRGAVERGSADGAQEGPPALQLSLPVAADADGCGGGGGDEDDAGGGDRPEGEWATLLQTIAAQVGRRTHVRLDGGKGPKF